MITDKEIAQNYKKEILEKLSKITLNVATIGISYVHHDKMGHILRKVLYDIEKSDLTNKHFFSLREFDEEERLPHLFLDVVVNESVFIEQYFRERFRS